MKILITADTTAQVSPLATLIREAGHTPLIAQNTTDVIDKFRQEQPDLVLLNHPVNGDIVKELRNLSLHHWVPILFVIERADDSSLQQVIAQDGDDYLVKPITRTVFTTKLRLLQHMLLMQQQLQSTTKKFTSLAHVDALTGVSNRVDFDTLLKEKIEQHTFHNTLFAVLSIGLDHFRVINDNLGYSIGDLLLKSVAKRLRSCLRMDDIVARTGGDEFHIILDNIDNLHLAEDIATQIIETLSLPHHLANNEVQINCSIGITFFPNDGVTSELLIQNANLAMAQAKNLGRNNFQYFHQKLYEKRKEQTTIENALKFAIERDEFVLTYQPIFDLSRQAMIGMEALITWEHPKLGSISPNVFIPLAEENGLIDVIGKWSIHKAFAQAAKWYLAGFQQFKLAINLSPRHLLQANLPQVLTELIQKTQAPAHLLELELTETAAMTYSSLTEKIIHDINKIGIRIALDDFGSGYSSLSHLKNLPISTVKIDKSFVENITTNRHDAMIVKSMINLAKNLGLNIIAEGIESAEQLKLLLANGCPQGQGFYLSKPLNTEQITEILQKNHPTDKSH